MAKEETKQLRIDEACNSHLRIPSKSDLCVPKLWREDKPYKRPGRRCKVIQLKFKYSFGKIQS